MTKETKLTAEQMKALAPYERHFRQAIEAAWCSYPGQEGIRIMLDAWASITGRRYGYKPCCSNCLLNLVRDMGTIYFEQKRVLEEEAKKAAAEETPAKADSVAVEQAEAPKAGSKPSEGKATAKPKRKAKK